MLACVPDRQRPPVLDKSKIATAEAALWPLSFCLFLHPQYLPKLTQYLPCSTLRRQQILRKPHRDPALWVSKSDRLPMPLMPKHTFPPPQPAAFLSPKLISQSTRLHRITRMGRTRPHPPRRAGEDAVQHDYPPSPARRDRLATRQRRRAHVGARPPRAWPPDEARLGAG
jgi:hypothetical protein